MSEPSEIPSVEQVYADQLRQDFAGIVARLRRMADDIEREAKQLDTPARVPRYADLVGTVQNDLLWGVANLNLGSLTRHAQQADEYRLKGE